MSASSLPTTHTPETWATLAIELMHKLLESEASVLDTPMDAEAFAKWAGVSRQKAQTILAADGPGVFMVGRVRRVHPRTWLKAKGCKV